MMPTPPKISAAPLKAAAIVIDRPTSSSSRTSLKPTVVSVMTVMYSESETDQRSQSQYRPV